MTDAREPGAGRHEVLLLRLEGHLMAFGGPMVDQRGPTRRFPGLSMLTGLLANALGWDHGDADALNELQARLRFAAALLREGEPLRDYQTVDLGQDHLRNGGWTTRGAIERRRGGEASSGTHIRLRDYLADAALVVALRLDPPGVFPAVGDLADALERPARPLFVGRKACPPSAPILIGRLRADDLVTALQDAAKHPDLAERLPTTGKALVEVEAPPSKTGEAAGMIDGLDEERLVDRRDWRKQLHGGERLVRRLRVAWPAGRPA